MAEHTLKTLDFIVGDSTYHIKPETGTMVFKGTIGLSGATISGLPENHVKGWTYKVITAGTYAGVNCEVGDLVICIEDGTSVNNAHWTIAQSNLDHTVTGPVSSTANHVATFVGTSGEVIQDSGFTIGASVPANAIFTDTTYSEATTTSAGLLSASDKAKLDGITNSTTLIDDTAGDNDTDKTWSADKLVDQFALKSDKIVILSYGSSTWNDFLTAYNKNAIVYCRASSNSNPASGAQTRMAFMAFVNNTPPTQVEFQYYRSVSSHSNTQMCDQVFIYTLNSSGTWSVTTREAGLKQINTSGDNISATYSSNAITLSVPLESKTAASSGTDVSLVTTGEKYIWNNKVDKVSNPTNGNFAGFDSNGNLIDSGSKASDFLTSHQDVGIIASLDTVTNSNGGSYTHTTTGLSNVTASMKAVNIECSDPSIFHAPIQIDVSDGEIALTCSDVKGTSSVTLTLIVVT